MSPLRGLNEIDDIGIGSQVIDDNISVELQMGETTDGEPIFWDLIEVEVERSKITEPDYAIGIARPKEDFVENVREKIDDIETEKNKAFGISAIVGDPFVLSVDTKLGMQVSSVTGNFTRKRFGSSGTESSLLFTGNIATLSPRGDTTYKFTAFDPTEQPFNNAEESGSLINKTLDLSGSTPEIIEPGGTKAQKAQQKNEPGSYFVKSQKLVEQVVGELEFLDEEDVIIDLDPGRAVNLDPVAESISPLLIRFDKAVVSLEKVLDRVREVTRSEWWVNREGEFYFGDPEVLDGGVRVFDLKLITDTTAGITTPPFQSVKAIGSSIVSEGGESAASIIQDDENKIVKAVNIGLPDFDAAEAKVSVTKGAGQELFEPTFTYLNTSLTTDIQVENAAISIAQDIRDQQAEGVITVVGLPEIDPFDGVRMPNSIKQPMGGRAYGVYAIRHKINSSDGFITEIEVSGPSVPVNNIVDINPEDTAVAGKYGNTNDFDRGLYAEAERRDRLAQERAEQRFQQAERESEEKEEEERRRVDRT